MKRLTAVVFLWLVVVVGCGEDGAVVGPSDPVAVGVSWIGADRYCDSTVFVAIIETSKSGPVYVSDGRVVPDRVLVGKQSVRWMVPLVPLDGPEVWLTVHGQQIVRYNPPPSCR